MSVITDFTEAMAKYEQSKGIPAGYKIEGKEPYWNYMSNDAWEAMRKGMPDAVEKQYGAGSGGELEEDKRSGTPPKMAAFHSSSRMIYLLSKDFDNFVFEKKLSTVVGGTSNMDGYYRDDDRTVYVEAKCREIYGHPVPEKISVKYIPVYTYLAKQMPSVFAFDANKHDERNQNVTFYSKGRKVTGFDVKQMICHLFAVAADQLQQKQPVCRIDFLYLIYDPSKLPLTLESKYEIMEIYRRAVADAENLEIEVMFGHIVEYLSSLEKFREKVKADKGIVKNSFRFHICNQSTYTLSNL